MLDCQIAENGNAVKVAFDIDSPMTADSYVKAVHVFADGNPTPDVASSTILLQAVRVVPLQNASCKTQNIIVLAEMGDGSFQQASATVKVTIGGCGG